MPIFQDLTGQKFGMLTALSYVGKRKWLWQCECGQQKTILSSSVKSGKTRSCGCQAYQHDVKKNLVGERFGRLVVTGLGEDKFRRDGKRIVCWNCVCDCGNHTTVTSGHLTSGHTISCGCAHVEQMERWKTYGQTHGKTNEKSHKTWQYIKARCYVQSYGKGFEYYGGRGIKMWDGWIHNAGAFCEYVENLPGYEDENTTIDRIDTNGDYEPGNLRWITIQRQQNNRRSNVFLTYNGKTQTAADWGRELGIKAPTIRSRLARGYSVEDALEKGKKSDGAAGMSEGKEQDVDQGL